MRLNPAFVFTLLLAGILAGCGDGGGQDSEPAFISLPIAGGAWGRAIREAYFEPFTEETGIEVRAVPGGDDPLAALEAQRIAGAIQFDLVVLEDYAIARALEKFDDHGLEQPDDIMLPVAFPEKAVPLAAETGWIIACNRAQVERCPQNYAEFFDDESFPGERSIPNVAVTDTSGILEAALIADGVDPDDLIPMDLDRAFRKLEGIKDSIRMFWTSFAASQDVLRSGEAAIALMTDGRAKQLMVDYELDLSIAYPGAAISYVHFVIPAGAPNPDGARRFMRWALENPQAEAVFSSITYYTPVSKRGIKAAERLGVSTESMKNLDRIRVETLARVEKNSAWITENGGAIMERWNEFVSR